MSDALALMQLLRLAGPALPVGAFAYSQGLEWQVEIGAGDERDRAGGRLEGLLRHALGRRQVQAVRSRWSQPPTARTLPPRAVRRSTAC